jgi:dephospho-CoA kinase
LQKKWPDKFVIGLTGNIGTGKSVVRRMLEHLGAHGIDADLIGHEVIEPGSEGYKQVVNDFGIEILTEQGEINRKKLAEIVFTSPRKLESLENIIHPLVMKRIDELILDSFSSVIVIEAIKLIEANIAQYCDSIWVTWVSEEQQINRLIQLRGMTYTDAQLRVSVQSPQVDKLRKADLIIRTGDSFENTWDQVADAWKNELPLGISNQIKQGSGSLETGSGFTIIRATPSQSEWIAQFLQGIPGNEGQITSAQITAKLCEKAILLLIKEGQISGKLEWCGERRISETTGIILDPQIQILTTLSLFIKRMEKISLDYHCRLALVVPGKQLFKLVEIWADLGYRSIQPHELEVLSWQKAAFRMASQDDGLMYKQLESS